ncbi:FliI/YscN family ATPase [Alicyclobacillus cycloheptanicus]|uniref:FliI/YscN family ATPase n=1 Tax=Alicyclobacillus cycloheptanicus TaxID=1457 RepID=UPI00237850C3|nr:FliI/YscN family ATPase [Alicyclobacillus cycloheptanicus]WDM02770.1 FliI/YscN family ATPase [Alicyclobacillus cycloheptanicus]
MNAAEVVRQLHNTHWYRLYGRVVKVIGMTMESVGPHANLGDLCAVFTDQEEPCLAEVVGFRDSRLILMPLGDVSAVSPGANVLALRTRLNVPVGDGLLGRVLNGLGQPMDGLGPLLDRDTAPIDAAPPNPLERLPIDQPLQTGVRAIDSLLTVGAGQRIGLFAGSGVGKSTLLSMIARNTSADVNVIALVGERGREVREFIERDLGASGLARSVVVVATSDQPALIRLKAAFVATAIAEHFRDRGQSVNLMMDSVTRFAMAQREIGLAVGEPPTSRGYTPSVFHLLPKLMERTGAGRTGTITAFYTVLVDGDDMNDPIADTVRGILDGHIVLTRSMANAGRFPAIDVLASLSRLFSHLAKPGHAAAAVQLRSWLTKYREVEDLIRIGAYQPGSDPEADIAISMLPRIRAFLEQRTDERSSFAETMEQLFALTGVQA